MGDLPECERFNYKKMLCDNPIFENGTCNYYNKETKSCEMDDATWHWQKGERGIEG